MTRGTRTVYPVKRNKGLSSTFQPPEEGWSVQRPKRCDKHGDKDEDNSPKNVNNAPKTIKELSENFKDSWRRTIYNSGLIKVLGLKYPKPLQTQQASEEGRRFNDWNFMRRKMINSNVCIHTGLCIFWQVFFIFFYLSRYYWRPLTMFLSIAFNIPLFLYKSKNICFIFVYNNIHVILH